MVIALIAIVLGFFRGRWLPIFYDGSYAIYVSVGMMASIDSIVGAIHASLMGTYKNGIFVSGFFVNSVLAFFLAYIGDVLGLPLYYSALFVFGTRLFDNMAKIRRHFIEKYVEKKSKEAMKKQKEKERMQGDV